MHIVINQKSYEVAADTTLEQALALINAQPPFAVAINLNFVPRNQYAQVLSENCQIEVVAPITGG